MAELYTPDDGEIEVGYAERAERVCGTMHFAACAEFDRWLAKVKADVWDEAYGTGVSDWQTSLDFDGGRTGPARINPYRTQECDQSC